MINTEYRDVNGHILFDFNNQSILLDTGSPISMGEGKFKLAGLSYELQNDYMGIDNKVISKYLDEDFDVLLGMDILQKYDLKVDPIQKRIEIANNIPVKAGIPSLKIQQIMSIPVIYIEIDSIAHKLVFDTGAQLSYIKSDFIGDSESVGILEDFYPGIGEFETDIFLKEISLFDENLSFEFGVLPDELEILLQLIGVNGIIGTYLLNYYGFVLSNSRLYLYIIKSN
jgi:hypothetical protein